MTYRSDIDGLRAIAILLVLLFHGGFAQFSSGFIGVDIFFVISGFLITRVIHDALDKNHFSFIDFYNRRLWRMQPVFICLILVTTLLAFLFFLPDDFMLYGKSARKTSVFLSNQFFSRVTSGYFSPETHQLPLLHTWSLAIEWQCYLMLPVMMYGLQKICGKKQLFKVIVLLTCIFLSISLYLSSYYSAKTYYQLMSRVFEFLIGACVALNPYPIPRYRYLLETLGVLSIGAFIYIAARHDISLGFPNGYALLIGMATGLLIVIGEHQPRLKVSQFLSIKPLVWVGLISYSLYIWHWPILTFIHYLDVPNTALMVSIAFCVIFILSYLSWRFIEKPTRRQAHYKPLTYSLICLVVLPAIIMHAGAFWIRKFEGYPQRFPNFAKINHQLKAYENLTRQRCLQQKDGEIDKNCLLGSQMASARKGLMIGDSFANHHWLFMDKLAKEANVSVLAHSIASCLALPDLAQYAWYVPGQIYQECQTQVKRYYEMIQANHYDFVILGESWSGYLGDRIIHELNDERSEALTKTRIEAALDKALQTIIASGATPIILEATAFTSTINPHDCFYHYIKWHQPYSLKTCDFHLEAKEQWFHELFSKMQKKYVKLVIIDPKEVQCNTHGQCPATIHGVPAFRDAVHITDYASYQLAKRYLAKYSNPLIKLS